MTAVISAAALSSPVLGRDISYALPAPAQRDGASAAQPWTVTRCQRLLRPLLSHLGRLRREKASEATRVVERDGNTPSVEAAALPPRSNKRGVADENLGARKRVRYTYSLKGSGRRSRAEHKVKPSRTLRPKQQQYVRPGEVVMSTPILSRARKHAVLSSSPISGATAPADATTPKPEAHEQPRSGKCASFYRGYYHGPPRPGSGKSSSSPMDEDWARMRQVTPQQYHHLYESIFRSVDALLRATSTAPAVKATSGSLLAMCLRKMPQYMAACEEEEREEAAQQGCTPPSLSTAAKATVTSEIYDDLESLGHGATGWRHLRILARAQGIDIVKAAFSEGLLHTAFIRLLIQLCANLKAFKEAEELLPLLVEVGSANYPRPLEGTDSTFLKDAGPLAALHFLTKYSDETGRVSYPLQAIASLLDNGRLPVSWLSTQAFSGIWERAIRGISSRRTSARHVDVILNFASTAITCLARCETVDDLNNTSSPPNPAGSAIGAMESAPKPSSSYHTLVSILGSLAAVVILQHESCETGGRGVYSVLPAERRLAAIVLTCLTGPPPTNRTGKRHSSTHRKGVDQVSTRNFLLALAWSLSVYNQTRGADGENISQNESHSRCRRMAGHATPEQQRKFYEAAVTLIASIAQSCGRGSEAGESSKPARAYLLELCQHVAAALGLCFTTDSEDVFLDRIHADGAFLLAGRTNDLRDLAFAENLREVQEQRKKNAPQKTCGQGIKECLGAISSTEAATTENLAPSTHPNASGAHPNLFSGYRWEEGISEWVIASPKKPRCHPEGSRQNQSQNHNQKQLPGKRDGSEDEAGNTAVSEAKCIRVTRSMTIRSPSLPVLSIILPALVSSSAHGDGAEGGRATPAKPPREVVALIATEATSPPSSTSPSSPSMQSQKWNTKQESRCMRMAGRSSPGRRRTQRASRRISRGRASWPCQGRPRRRPRSETQTLLGLVSDDEEEGRDNSDSDSDSDEWDGTQYKDNEEHHSSGNDTPGRGRHRLLFHLGHRNATATGLGHTVQKHMLDEASDDELCL